MRKKADLIPRPKGWPEKAGDAAWRGPLGEYSLAIEPHTEADPHAILVSLMIAVGNVMGHHAYFEVGSTRHHANLFGLFLGPTAMGGKGMSTDEAMNLIDGLDKNWASPARGLSSGEGVIDLVRDPRIDTKRRPKKNEPPPMIEGVKDKRRLIIETEFGRPLRAMTRQGNTLMNVIQMAFDGSDLGSIVVANPLRATKPHISIIAHITSAELGELLRRANDVPLWNGFVNRFLWICTHRTKSIPSPINFRDTTAACLIHSRLMKSVGWVLSEKTRRFRRSKLAERFWQDELYDDLRKRTDDKVGAATTRAAPLVMRLAMIYAALDCSARINRAHLESAVALWQYCEASAKFVFTMVDLGRDTGRIRKLNEALQAAGGAGLSRTAIFKDVFQKNVHRDEITAMLKQLQEMGAVSMTETASPAGGTKPVEVWRWL
jgi:hypothetical protein